MKADLAKSPSSASSLMKKPLLGINEARHTNVGGGVFRQDGFAAMRNPHRADLIVITRDEYAKLKKAKHALQCLEAGGVDNWEWFGESMQPHFRKYYPEDYDDASPQ